MRPSWNTASVMFLHVQNIFIYSFHLVAPLYDNHLAYLEFICVTNSESGTEESTHICKVASMGFGFLVAWISDHSKQRITPYQYPQKSQPLKMSHMDCWGENKLFEIAENKCVTSVTKHDCNSKKQNKTKQSYDKSKSKISNYIQKLTLKKWIKHECNNWNSLEIALQTDFFPTLSLTCFN